MLPLGFSRNGGCSAEERTGDLDRERPLRLELPSQQTGPPSLNTLPATLHTKILKKEQVQSSEPRRDNGRRCAKPERRRFLHSTSGSRRPGPLQLSTTLQRSCPVTPWLDDDVCRLRTGTENEAKINFLLLCRYSQYSKIRSQSHREAERSTARQLCNTRLRHAVNDPDALSRPGAGACLSSVNRGVCRYFSAPASSVLPSGASHHTRRIATSHIISPPNLQHHPPPACDGCPRSDCWTR